MYILTDRWRQVDYAESVYSNNVDQGPITWMETCRKLVTRFSLETDERFSNAGHEWLYQSITQNLSKQSRGADDPLH